MKTPVVSFSDQELQEFRQALLVKSCKSIDDVNDGADFAVREKVIQNNAASFLETLKVSARGMSLATAIIVNATAHHDGKKENDEAFDRDAISWAFDTLSFQFLTRPEIAPKESRKIYDILQNWLVKGNLVTVDDNDNDSESNSNNLSRQCLLHRDDVLLKKHAHALACGAKAFFPEHWPNFFTDLFGLLNYLPNENDEKNNNAILRYFLQVWSNFISFLQNPSVPEWQFLRSRSNLIKDLVRRDDMIPKAIQIWYDILSGKYHHHDRQTLISSSSASTFENEKACLELLENCVPWIDVDLFITSEMVDMYYKYIEQQNCATLQESALNILIAIVQKSHMEKPRIIQQLEIIQRLPTVLNLAENNFGAEKQQQSEDIAENVTMSEKNETFLLCLVARVGVMSAEELLQFFPADDDEELKAMMSQLFAILLDMLKRHNEVFEIREMVISFVSQYIKTIRITEKECLEICNVFFDVAAEMVRRESSTSSQTAAEERDLTNEVERTLFTGFRLLYRKHPKIIVDFCCTKIDDVIRISSNSNNNIQSDVSLSVTFTSLRLLVEMGEIFVSESSSLSRALGANNKSPDATPTLHRLSQTCIKLLTSSRQILIPSNNTSNKSSSSEFSATILNNIIHKIFFDIVVRYVPAMKITLSSSSSSSLLEMTQHNSNNKDSAMHALFAQAVDAFLFLENGGVLHPLSEVRSRICHNFCIFTGQLQKKTQIKISREEAEKIVRRLVEIVFLVDVRNEEGGGEKQKNIILAEREKSSLSEVLGYYLALSEMTGEVFDEITQRVTEATISIQSSDLRDLSTSSTSFAELLSVISSLIRGIASWIEDSRESHSYDEVRLRVVVLNFSSWLFDNVIIISNFLERRGTKKEEDTSLNANQNNNTHTGNESNHNVVVVLERSLVFLQQVILAFGPASLHLAEKLLKPILEKIETRVNRTKFDISSSSLIVRCYRCLSQIVQVEGFDAHDNELTRSAVVPLSLSVMMTMMMGASNASPQNNNMTLSLRQASEENHGRNQLLKTLLLFLDTLMNSCPLAVFVGKDMCERVSPRLITVLLDTLRTSSDLVITRTIVILFKKIFIASENICKIKKSLQAVAELRSSVSGEVEADEEMLEVSQGFRAQEAQNMRQVLPFAEIFPIACEWLTRTANNNNNNNNDGFFREAQVFVVVAEIANLIRLVDVQGKRLQNENNNDVDDDDGRVTFGERLRTMLVDFGYCSEEDIQKYIQVAAPAVETQTILDISATPAMKYTLKDLLETIAKNRGKQK